MSRSSREVTALRREAVVQAASRLFRQHGPDAVSVPDLAAAAGLTHGGFYRHFESKQALEAEAYERGLEQMAELVWSLIEREGPAARDALFDHYLSPAHRDGMGEACATTALAVDAARRPAGHGLRQAVGAGVARMADILEGLNAEAGPDARRQALAQFSTLIGALILARATAGTALSDDILQAARSSLQPAKEMTAPFRRPT